MLDLEGVRALSQELDYTFSGSDGQYKVSHDISEGTFRLRDKAVFQFADHQSLKLQTDRLSKVSEDTLKEAVKRAKQAYDGASDSTLKTKLVADNDDVQLIGTTIYSPRRTAYYTRVLTYSLD